MGASKTNQYSANTKAIANIALALSHPARIQIIQSLFEKSVIRNLELQKMLCLSKTCVNHHVSKLQRADIVELVYNNKEYNLKLNYQNIQYFNDFLNAD